MKITAILLAGGVAFAAVVPASAQTVTVTQNHPNALPWPYDYTAPGPYAGDLPGSYALGYDAYAYEPYAYAPESDYPRGYWSDGRYYQCTQSYTPNRPDRSAGGSNVTEQCF